MSAPSPVVPPARIRYRDDQPYSLDYQDIYHSADGAAEVQRVFVAPCRLDDLAGARAGRSGPGADLVRVGELGFGSGLNLVIAAERCLAAGARLHFVSFESAPLDHGDFAAIAGRRAARHPLYRELAAAYPPRIRGWHRRWLAGGRVRLSLWWGDADAGLTDLRGRQLRPMDAWFLDGFAPDRNPELWHPGLFAAVAALSGTGTRVATFTAAGRVRRGLEGAGFAMVRVDQRPHKRESLAGTFQGRALAGGPGPARAVVAGAGLAGASAAWHLARAGVDVRLFDPALAGQPAGGRPGDTDDADRLRPRDPDPDAVQPASAIPATVLHGRLLADGTPQAALRCHAFLYAAHVAAPLPGFRPSGVLQLPPHGQDDARLRALAAAYGPSGPWLRFLERDDAAALAGWDVAEGALHFPTAGAVDTPALVRALLEHPNVETVPERLERAPAQVPVILACGAATRHFREARYLEVASVHGQLDLVEIAQRPRLPLVGRGYLVPSGGRLAAGATYEYRPWDPDHSTRANLAQLGDRRYRWCGRCRGTRSVSSDRTAIAGPLYDLAGKVVAERWVSAGHGSAGNVSAHLAGAVLADLITGEAPALARPLADALSPYRFRARQARRGYRHGAAD